MTGLFYQSNWQRIFAARDNKVIRKEIILSGLLSFPIILIMGLFGLANLLCCAAAFQVFFGFYNARYQSCNAALSTFASLVAGLMLFPAPGAPLTYLLESFLLASLVPIAVSLLLLLMPKTKLFDFSSLAQRVRNLKG
jgi:hypothetical protein